MRDEFVRVRTGNGYESTVSKAYADSVEKSLPERPSTM